MFVNIILWLSTITHPATVYHPTGNAAFIIENTITDTEFNPLGTIIADTLYNADGIALCSITRKEIHILKPDTRLRIKAGIVYDKWGRAILKINAGKIKDIQDRTILYYIHTKRREYPQLILYTIFFNGYNPIPNPPART